MPPDVVLLLAPLAAPLLAAASAAAVGWRRTVGWLTVASAAAILLAGILVGTRTAGGGSLVLGVAMRADALSAVMLLVIGAVGIVGSWAGIAWLDDEVRAGRTSERDAMVYATLVPVFLAVMALAVLASNLGLVWAAIEASTIVTAFLVGHRRTSAALEAAWKYVLICSVGVALAYLGTVLTFFAARHSGPGTEGSLDWHQLAADSAHLDSGVMRIAFALLVIGFGAKVGLVPLHSWLPDAYGQAPAPVTALLSGILPSVAVYALLRYRMVAADALSPTFIRVLLFSLALLTIAFAASMLLQQRDFKRLLAYSSMEHMGLIIVGVAVGTPLAIAAVLLHMLGQGICKAVLFCSAGQIARLEGTTRIKDVRGLLGRRPPLGGVFVVGLAALLGFPPFSLFASQFGLARATVAAGLGWVAAVTFTLMLVAVIAVLSRMSPMLLGSAEPALEPPTSGGSSSGAASSSGGGSPSGAASAAHLAPMVVGLGALAVLGVLAWPLAPLLHTAATTVGVR